MLYSCGPQLPGGLLEAEDACDPCRILFIWLNMSGKVFVFTRFTNTLRFKQVLTIRINIDFLEEISTKVMTFSSVRTIFCLVWVLKRAAAMLSRKESRWRRHPRLTVGLKFWFLLSPRRQCLGTASMLLCTAGRLRQTPSIPALVTGVCMSPRTKVSGFETEVMIVLWQMHSPESWNVLYNNKSSYWTVRCYGKGSRGADLRHSMWGGGLCRYSSRELQRLKDGQKKIQHRLREQTQVEKFVVICF